MDNRIKRIDLYMGIAKLFSQRSTCLRGQVGVIAVKDNRVIASGYNGSPVGFAHCNDDNCNISKPCENSIHAEANLIAFSARVGISLEGSILYCTHQPCIKCAQLIIQAGIKEVIFENEYRDNSGLKLLKEGLIKVLKYVKV